MERKMEQAGNKIRLQQLLRKHRADRSLFAMTHEFATFDSERIVLRVLSLSSGNRKELRKAPHFLNAKPLPIIGLRNCSAPNRVTEE